MGESCREMVLRNIVGDSVAVLVAMGGTGVGRQLHCGVGGNKNVNGA